MPNPLEHVPTVDRVNAYLAPRAEGDLCPEVTACAPWPAEAFLMDDLARHARTEAPLPTADLATVRLYLRAVSWFRAPALTEAELLAHLDALPGLDAADRALFHAAIAGHPEAEAIEPAARRIDTLSIQAWEGLQESCRVAGLSWQALDTEPLPAEVAAAKGRVEGLRPLRDAVYFRRHLSHWMV